MEKAFKHLTPLVDIVAPQDQYGNRTVRDMSLGQTLAHTPEILGGMVTGGAGAVDEIVQGTDVLSTEEIAQMLKQEIDQNPNMTREELVNTIQKLKSENIYSDSTLMNWGDSALKGVSK